VRGQGGAGGYGILSGQYFRFLSRLEHSLGCGIGTCGIVCSVQVVLNPESVLTVQAVLDVDREKA